MDASAYISLETHQEAAHGSYLWGREPKVGWGTYFSEVTLLYYVDFLPWACL